MYLKNLLLSIGTPFLLSLLFTVAAYAQPTTCSEFEQLELNQQFGKSAGNENGDKIKLLDNDVITTLQRFNYSSTDTPGFGDVTVVDWEFGNLDKTNQYLFVSNINLVFDFSEQPDVVSLVSFDFVDGGGEENIGVNGHTAHILEFLHKAPKEIAPNITFEVFLDSSSEIPSGKIFIYGDIKELVLGGQELGIDNFCWVVNDVSPQCISEVTAKPQPCTPNGIFYTEIFFETNNPASDSFFIKGNGQNYGKFPYGQSSYKVGPIEANPNTDYEFVIVDALDPNCTNFTEIGSVSCNDTSCRISDLDIKLSECKDDGTVDVHLNFEYGTLNGSEFKVFLNGKKYDALKLEDLPVVLKDVKLYGDSNSLEVCVFQSTTPDTDDNFECCVKGTFLGPDCNNISDCKIYDLVAEPSDCKDNGLFGLEFKFQHKNANTAGFDAFIDGEFHEFIPYNAGEGYKFTDLNLPYGAHKLTICGNDNTNCCQSIEFKAPDCNNTDCKIYDLGVEANTCNVFGEFYVDVFFQVKNPASDSFTIESNDGLLGTFAYGKNFYRVGPFKGDGITRYYFAIVDSRDTNCGEKTIIEPVGCVNENCTITNLKAEISDCQFDGSVDLTVSVAFDFNTTIDLASTYSIFIGDRLLGSFPISDRELTFNNLQLAIGSYTLTACLDINSVCCKRIEIEVAECQGECRVFDIKTEVSPCKENGLHDVTIDFRHEAINKFLEIYIGETKYDSLTVDQLPITLKDVKLAKEKDWIGICVYQSSTPLTTDIFQCCSRTVIEVPDCLGEACNFSNLNKEHIECLEDGTYYMEFRVEAKNLFDIEQTYVTIGEGKYKVFKATNGLLAIKGVKAKEGWNRFSFCDEVCCITSEFYAPNCNNMDCKIKGLVAGTSGCKEDGTVVLEFKFDHELLSDSLFKIKIDDGDYQYHEVNPNGNYRIDQLKLTAGEHSLLVCSSSVPGCCTEVIFEAPDCGNNLEDCKIYEVFAEAHPCKADGSFLVDVDFEIKNSTAASFKIYANDQSFGPYEYGKPFYTIGPLRGDGITKYEIVVKDIENPDCQGHTTLSAINCNQDSTCQLNDLRASVSDCLDNGSVDIEVKFEFDNPSNSGFNVFIDEQYIETYGFHQIPFVLNQSNLSPGSHKLSICRNDAPNCCISTAISIPECGTCNISNVTAIATACENEDFFYVDLKFDLANPSADRFRVVGNSNLYGIFPYGRDSYRLGPLDGDGETMYEFIVQDLKNETCASFAELEKTVDCEQGFVWPGDANFDNITDNFDLLNIGLAFGKRGPIRVVDIASAIAWEGQEADNWGFEFKNGVNIKHADCNGDGVVNEADIKAIDENYFFTHGPIPDRVISNGEDNAPKLFIEFPPLSQIEIGKEIKAPIIFGEEDLPAKTYGLAFTLKFDPKLVKDANIQFSDSWLAENKEELLTINKNFKKDGFIEVAMTRKDGLNKVGAGAIGHFIIIIDNIEGFTEQTEIEISKVQAIDREGNILPVFTPKTIISPLTETEEEGTDDIDITLYPNPSSDFISIKNSGEKSINEVRIQSVSGRIIRTVNISDLGAINITDLANGVYIIAIQTGSKTLYRKLVKQ